MLKGESNGPCRLAMVVALLSRIRVFSFALVSIKRLGVDPSPDHLVDRGDLLPQVWLAKGPVRNLAPYQVVRPLLLGMAARSRTRGPCASARTRRESRQGQRIWGHQNLYASFPIDAGRADRCSQAIGCNRGWLDRSAARAALRMAGVSACSPATGLERHLSWRRHGAGGRASAFAGRGMFSCGPSRGSV